ncbi:MAG: hypothetical protein ACOYWZ_14030 [Bacillota bacterium]
MRVRLLFILASFIVLVSCSAPQHISEKNEARGQDIKASDNSNNTAAGKISDSDILNSFNTDSLDELFDSYYDKIDGAHAEGYAYNLYRLHKGSDTKTFIKKLSSFEKYKIEGIAALLVSQVFMEEDISLVNEFESKHEKLLKDNSLTLMETYVVYEVLGEVKYLRNRSKVY